MKDKNKVNKPDFGGKAVRAGSGPLWKFSEKNDGSFLVPEAEYISRLYFPLMNMHGMKCSVTPELKGDICSNFQSYLTVATVTEELHRNISGRNFWISVEGHEPWSLAGTSVFQKASKWTENADDSQVEGSIGSFKLERINRQLSLKSNVTVFVPSTPDMLEIMLVEVENIGDRLQTIVPTSCLPIFGRHADNIRDHRQVTTMFQYTYLLPHGVRVKPTIVHDERGHTVNQTNYIVLGFSEEGEHPAEVWGDLREFLGEGGSLDNPEAIYFNLKAPEVEGRVISGREAVAAMRFDPVHLKPGQKKTYILLHGITEDFADIELWQQKFNTRKKAEVALTQTLQYWQNVVNRVSFHTGDAVVDNWIKWVSFQLKCRQIFGNSYLPDFGYGRGGRGWRDLWQDLLSIFLVDPESARDEIINNFQGIRVDGSNATIIGTRPGEFIADRNNVPRTWCDHGAWPVFVLNFYIQQSGDFDILLKDLPYWKDVFTFRSTRKDEFWQEKDGFQQRTVSGEIYRGSIFEHILLQQLSAFFNVGEHNNLLLEGADWNDTLDMARQRGESVCFYNFYGANLYILVSLLKALKKSGLQQIELLDEITILLDRLADQKPVDYQNPDAKKERLFQFFEKISHTVSGRKQHIPVDDLIMDLQTKADHVFQHIRQNEWLTTQDNLGFYNGHYDDDARRVHGDHPLGVRMDLTSQVMPTMFGTAEDEQIREIYKAVKKYLKDPGEPGIRLCTDFKELKLNLGRITGFVYGYKEHGSKWMQQNIMFMYGLYRRGFVREGYEVFREILELCTRSEVARIFPGIPSYFGPGNRGGYAYLTGSSTWLMLTLTTQIFGVSGEAGNLVLEPKLVAEQFKPAGRTALECTFRNIQLLIEYVNNNLKEWGVYHIKEVIINDKRLQTAILDSDGRVMMTYHSLQKVCDRDLNKIQVVLD